MQDALWDVLGFAAVRTISQSLIFNLMSQKTAKIPEVCLSFTLSPPAVPPHITTTSQPQIGTGTVQGRTQPLAVHAHDCAGLSRVQTCVTASLRVPAVPAPPSPPSPSQPLLPTDLSSVRQCSSVNENAIWAPPSTHTRVPAAGPWVAEVEGGCFEQYWGPAHAPHPSALAFGLQMVLPCFQVSRSLCCG